MGQNKTLSSIFLATTSFVGGMAAGLLLAPRKGSQNRAWISNHTTELTDWVDTQGRMARYKSNRQMRNLRNNVHKGIQQNIPNLYKATEQINLSDNDVFSE